MVIHLCFVQPKCNYSYVDRSDCHMFGSRLRNQCLLNASISKQCNHLRWCVRTLESCAATNSQQFSYASDCMSHILQTYKLA